MRALSLALALTSAVVASAAPAQAPSAALREAVSGPHRTETNRVRDPYRHPAETLAFFGIKPGDTVVELWPGGGWYTEILAHYLSKGGGQLIVAAPGQQGLQGTQKRLTANAELYGKVQAVNFPTVLGGTGVAPGTADAVLTFRNVHNWRMGAMHPDKTDYSAQAFREIFAMLKPGGVLGIVDHRLPENASAERERSSGYMKTSTIRQLAQQAGFRLAGSSEVNANRKDSADWPKGVWTLPPNFAEGDADKAKYQAIGESDRMTLKFVKPAN